MRDSDPVPYKPSASLLARSLLTQEELSEQYEEFKANIDYLATAPKLVFESMIANVNQAVLSRLEAERRENTTALQAMESRNQALQTTVEEQKRRIQTLETKNAEIGKTALVAETTPEPAGGFWSQMRNTMVSSNVDWTRLEITAFLEFSFETTPWRVSSKAQVPRGHFSKLSNIGFSWLDIAAANSHPNFRHGTYMTLDRHFKGSLRSENAFVIKFEPPFFSVPPKVVVWLGGIEMHLLNAWRVKTYATDVTETGFILHIDTWGDSKILTAGASWVAFPGDDKSICTGRLDTWSPQTWKSATLKKDGHAEYEYPPENNGPHRQLLLIDTIEVANAQGLSLSLGFGPEAAPGSINWVMNAGPPEARLYSVGATYLVMTEQQK